MICLKHVITPPQSFFSSVWFSKYFSIDGFLLRSFKNIALPSIFIPCNRFMHKTIFLFKGSFIITDYIRPCECIWLSLSDFFVLISRFLNSFWISFGSKNIWVLIWLSCCSWLNRISVELSISDFFLHHINWCWIWSLILKVNAAFKCVWSPFILVCNVRVNIIMWIYIFTIFSLVFLSCFHLSITFIN